MKDLLSCSIIFLCCLQFISNHKLYRRDRGSSRQAVAVGSNLTWADFERQRLNSRLSHWNRGRIPTNGDGSGSLERSEEQHREPLSCPPCPLPPPRTVIQCPQTPPPMTYDRNYQAATLEEAMLNFQDLTIPEAHSHFSSNKRVKPPAPAYGKVTGYGSGRGAGGAGGESAGPQTTSFVSGDVSGACAPGDRSCQSCTCALIKRLNENRLLEKSGMRDRSHELEQNLGLNCTSVAGVPCSRYRFSNRNIKQVPKSNLRVAPELQRFTVESIPKVKRLMQALHLDTVKAPMPMSPITRSRTAFGSQPSSVSPPQNDVQNDIQGEQNFNIACVSRGDAETESVESWVVMCDMCWSWRVLPHEYFPRYINELRCSSSNSDGEADSGQGKCLGKLGDCQQREKTMTVQKNLGTVGEPDWQPVDISTSTCCDCKVLSGSPMHAFVAK